MSAELMKGPRRAPSFFPQGPKGTVRGRGYFGGGDLRGNSVPSTWETLTVRNHPRRLRSCSEQAPEICPEWIGHPLRAERGLTLLRTGPPVDAEDAGQCRRPAALEADGDEGVSARASAAEPGRSPPRARRSGSGSAGRGRQPVQKGPPKGQRACLPCPGPRLNPAPPP